MGPSYPGHHHRAAADLEAGRQLRQQAQRQLAAGRAAVQWLCLAADGGAGRGPE